MKIVKTFLLLLIFQSILFAQSGWVRDISIPPNPISKVYFTDINTGYLIGIAFGYYNGFLYKTTNAGTYWEYYGENPRGYNSICFTDENTGYIGTSWWAYHEHDARILKTTNAGSNWFEIGVFQDPVFDIEFINGETGYAASSGYVHKTTDAGSSWVPTELEPTYLRYLFDICFVNEQTGYITSQSGIVYKTSNAGNSWQIINIPSASSYFLHSAYFFNSLTGFVCGGDDYNSVLLKTTNGGSNWNVQGILTNQTLRSVLFTSQDTGYIAAGKNYSLDSGSVFKSTNGGIDWFKSTTAAYPFLNNLFFFNSNTGYACGYYGALIKTTNGGVTIGINPISTEIPNNFSLSQNYPNPFNPSTKIRFDIPQTVGNGRDRSVKLTIYDLLGREAAVLVNEELNPGVYEVDFDGSSLPSGVYYYRLASGNYTQTKKMVLLK